MNAVLQRYIMSTSERSCDARSAHTTSHDGSCNGSKASPREAAAILDRVAAGSEKATPKTVFEPGEIVRVIDGPFNDFNGVVEEVNYEKSRLRVAVTIFGRSTPVELDFGQVEKG